MDVILQCFQFGYSSQDTGKKDSAGIINKETIQYSYIHNGLQLFEKYLRYYLATLANDPVSETMFYYYSKNSKLSLSSSFSSSSSSSATKQSIESSNDTDLLFKTKFQELIFYLFVNISTLSETTYYTENFIHVIIDEYFQLSNYHQTILSSMDNIKLSLSQISIYLLSKLFTIFYIQEYTFQNITINKKEELQTISFQHYINILHYYLQPTIPLPVDIPESKLLSQNISLLLPVRQVWGTRIISCINNLCSLQSNNRDSDSSSSSTNSSLPFQSHQISDIIWNFVGQPSESLLQTLFFMIHLLSPSSLSSTTEISLSTSQFFHSLFYSNDRTVLMDMLLKELYNCSEKKLQILYIIILQQLHLRILDEGHPAVYKDKIKTCIEQLRQSESRITKISKDNYTEIDILFQQCLKNMDEALLVPELEY